MDELFQVKRILLISYFFVSIQIVKGRYEFSPGTKCNYRNVGGTNLYRLNLEQCKKECCERATCRAVDYFRREQKCALLHATYYIGIVTGKESTCVHLAKEKIKCLIACPCTSTDTCADVSETCAVKECAPIGDLQNVHILGNMNQFGSRLKIKCVQGYRETTNRLTTECLPTRSWSYLPQCIPVTIGSYCTRDNDCVETGSVCIGDRCFCGLLYRYDYTVLDCVKVCNRMTDEFTEYPKTYIKSFNMDPQFVKDCRTSCIKNPACYSYEIFTSCFYGTLSYEMAMDVDPEILGKNPGETLYSRKCK